MAIREYKPCPDCREPTEQDGRCNRCGGTGRIVRERTSAGSAAERPAIEEPKTNVEESKPNKDENDA